VSAARAKIFSHEGYIFEEVLSGMLRRFGDEEARLKLKDVLELPIATRTGKRPEPVPDQMEFPSSAFVFDPSELPEVEERAEAMNLVPLVLPHGLEIPMGLGFSLPMLPWLLKNGNWQRLLRSVQPILSGNGWPHKFREAGLVLEPERFAPIAEGADAQQTEACDRSSVSSSAAEPQR
jgi:hypothetical protein